jgi:hypothetical protein
MIMMLGASAMLWVLQASIAAPTEAFRGCLHQAATKAKDDKVTAENIENYLRDACTVQMGTLKDALVAFRLKNGMGKKTAADDAEMTISDYVSTPADNYKFMANLGKPQPQPQPAAAPATPPTPQQPKP